MALQSLESNPQLSFATRMEDWTSLGQHKRHPEFPVVTRESRRNSRKTTWFPRHRKMKPFPATASHTDGVTEENGSCTEIWGDLKRRLGKKGKKISSLLSTHLLAFLPLSASCSTSVFLYFPMHYSFPLFFTSLGLSPVPSSNFLIYTKEARLSEEIPHKSKRII